MTVVTYPLVAGNYCYISSEHFKLMKYFFSCTAKYTAKEKRQNSDEKYLIRLESYNFFNDIKHVKIQGRGQVKQRKEKGKKLLMHEHFVALESFPVIEVLRADLLYVYRPNILISVFIFVTISQKCSCLTEQAFIFLLE